MSELHIKVFPTVMLGVVDEIKIYREQLERELFTMLERFETQTGTRIVAIKLEHICRIHRADCRLSKVEVEVQL